jgi:hypothetical protein
MTKQIKKAQQRIEEIKNNLLEIGPMRPGKLSQQKRKDRDGKYYGSYWQLGYTYKMKPQSNYVPTELIETVRSQTETYKKFRELTDEWIELALSIAKNEFETAKKGLKKNK